MKLLVDANLSPKVAEGLAAAGFDATHVAELDLLQASDEAIFERAVQDGFVVVTADSDFGMLLALRRTSSPSVLQLRHVAELVQPPTSNCWWRTWQRSPRTWTVVRSRR
jgi:predicted nuclease of predicted toxin-antitoxin system